MKYFVKFALFVGLVLLVASCAKSDTQEPARTESVAVPQATAPVQKNVGVPAIDFTLNDLEGNPVTLSSFKGKQPVFIKFWATWCGYCRREIPKITELREQYSPQELAILSIDIGESPQQVSQFAERVGINYTVLLDENSTVAQQYGVLGVPTMFLVTKEGRVVAKTHQIESHLLAMIEQAVSS